MIPEFSEADYAAAVRSVREFHFGKYREPGYFEPPEPKFKPRPFAAESVEPAPSSPAPRYKRLTIGEADQVRLERNRIAKSKRPAKVSPICLDCKKPTGRNIRAKRCTSCAYNTEKAAERALWEQRHGNGGKQAEPMYDTSALRLAVMAKRGKMAIKTAGRLAGMTGNSLRCFERGTSPTIRTMDKLCAWLGVGRGEFLRK